MLKLSHSVPNQQSDLVRGIADSVEMRISGVFYFINLICELRAILWSSKLRRQGGTCQELTESPIDMGTAAGRKPVIWAPHGGVSEESSGMWRRVVY
jgi:hypothetical protein